jgi:hypothetical protein
MGGQYINWRGNKQNLRGEVEFYLKLEQKVRAKWAGAMKALTAVNQQAIRLAVVTPQTLSKRQFSAFGKKE